MRRIIKTVTITALLAASAASAATPEDDIKYRKAVMMTMAGHFGAISLIATGKLPYQARLLSHAEALAAAGDQMSELFPAGSGSGETDALARIWAEPEQFQKAADAAKAATAQLRDAIKAGDKAAIGKAMRPVAESCKGCHDRYRKEQ
jgi:cytochrome c556